MLTVSSIAHAAVRVEDVASVLDIYCDKLGSAGMQQCRSEDHECQAIELMADNSMQAQTVACIGGR